MTCRRTGKAEIVKAAEETPAAPAELVSSIDFAPDGRSVVATLSGLQAPADLWRLDLDAGTWSRLTWSPHPGVDLAGMVKPELRTYTAHDGLELSGWLYLPKDFQAPGPVVLSFHGGPESQERPAFRGDYQALLASGIGVFAPNIRGSSGFGKAFMQMDNHAGRFDANRDIQSSAEFLVREGIGHLQDAGHAGGVVHRAVVDVVAFLALMLAQVVPVGHVQHGFVRAGGARQHAHHVA